jgi:V-type H+-transporting ATPase subunit d
MSTPSPQTAGNLATFNILHGYPEALVRGMRSSFMSDADYHHLSQCESLDDIRLNLTETDYGDAIADFNSITPAVLQKAAVEKVSPCSSRFIDCRNARKGGLANIFRYSCANL